MKTLRSPLTIATAMSLVFAQGCIRVNNSTAASPADAQTQADAAPEQAQPAAQDEQTTAVVAPAPLPQEEASAGEAAKTELPSVKDIVPPVCQKTGTRSEGWYRGEELLVHGPCEGVTPQCKMSGTRSEGWYNGDELIEYDQCDGKLPSEE